jgi:DNA-binding IclR family transcriptional regulator
LKENDLKIKLAKKNQSVEKVLQIIEVMAKNRGAMRLQDIAEELNQPTSTVLRFLNTLMAYNYVDQNPETLKYSLSLKFCQIGELVRSQISIRDIVKPYLFELSEICQESACLAIEQDMEVVYIDFVDGPDNMLKAMQRIGHRAPLHCTGVGKLLLMNYDEKKLKELISVKGLVKFTEHTITTEEQLLKELQKVKLQGYAFDNEECEIGAKCVAAPLRDYTGIVTASISVSGPVSRLTGDKLELIKDTVKKTAKVISLKLGWEDKNK